MICQSIANQAEYSNHRVPYIPSPTNFDSAFQIVFLDFVLERYRVLNARVSPSISQLGLGHYPVSNL